jgi:anti-anti-sigma regulatory factor
LSVPRKEVVVSRHDHLLKTEEEWVGDVLVVHFKHRRLEDKRMPVNTRVTKFVKEGASKVVADLSDVESIHHVFVEVLLVTMMKVDGLGATMLIACLQPAVLELIRKMHIDPYPPPWACETVSEAVSKLAEAERGG